MVWVFFVFFVFFVYFIYIAYIPRYGLMFHSQGNGASGRRKYTIGSSMILASHIALQGVLKGKAGPAAGCRVTRIPPPIIFTIMVIFLVLPSG